MLFEVEDTNLSNILVRVDEVKKQVTDLANTYDKGAKLAIADVNKQYVHNIKNFKFCEAKLEIVAPAGFSSRIFILRLELLGIILTEIQQEEIQKEIPIKVTTYEKMIDNIVYFDPTKTIKKMKYNIVAEDDEIPF